MDDLTQRKQELQSYLLKAMELELSTLPPYLTALMSIKPESNFTAASLIHSVAMEEMLHMLLVGNLITSLGGKVEFTDANVPSYPLSLEFEGQQFRDRKFNINLERFSPAAIDTFLKIEKPAELLRGDTKAFVGAEMEIPGITIGRFYELIQTTLVELCDLYPTSTVFSGDINHQIGEDFYWKGDGSPIVVHDLVSANEAIETIITQGEGCPDSIFDVDADYFGQTQDVAHYFKFKEIKHQRFYQQGVSPFDSPSGEMFDMDYDAVHPIIANPSAKYYQNMPRLARLNRRFNEIYSLMLYQIAEAFNGTSEILYTAINNGMRNLRPLAEEMMAIRLSGDKQACVAAPSFEWITPAVALQQNSEISLISKWQLLDGCPKVLKEQLDGLAAKVNAEAGTLMYLVNVQQSAPLNHEDKPKTDIASIPLALQTEVVFIEIYKNAEAFSRHVTGKVFTEFRHSTLQYFKPDPNRDDWPLTRTEFLSRCSGFIKPQAY